MMSMEEEAQLDTEAIIEEFEALTMDAGKVQRETLRRILEENGEVEYLQRCGLGGRTDPENFKARVPVVAHKDLEPYIQRIVDGTNLSALTRKPIDTMSRTTGTTEGKAKFVPFNNGYLEGGMKMYRTSFAFRNREYPAVNGKSLVFMYGSKHYETKGGLPARTVIGNVLHAMQFNKSSEAMRLPLCSPEEVIFGTDLHQSLYCHLLCGLISRDDIQVVSSAFAHSIVHAFRTFEQHWEELVSGIREGLLSSRITVPTMRTAMSKKIKPDLELADIIYSKCSGVSNWYGIIQELFPNVKYVHTIMTGSMEPYVKKLRHYAGDVPLISGDYISSESWIGFNINPKLPPELVTFAVRPDIAYYEFIPLNEQLDGEDEAGSRKLSAESQPVGLTEVKVGNEYEIVLTTPGGLYRYKLGDIVRVMRFHNSAPELQFICRKNVLLTINIDKNTEKDLQVAVESAAELLGKEGLEVVDFTSHANISTEPGHYVIFWETRGDPRHELLQECCNCLDRSFADVEYEISRKTNTIGALELKIVRKGTFQKIMDHGVEQGGAYSQFKTPRVVGPTKVAVLQILYENGIKTFFSTAY